MKQIIIFLFIILVNNSYSQTWEYKQSGNYRFGIVNFSEEYITGEVITLEIIRKHDSIPKEDRLVTSRINIHDSYTGDIIDSAIYKIDSLSCTLSWVFYSDSLNQYFIVGQARTKSIESLRGYFLLTKWDEDLNLLSDTLIRLQPFNETNTIWYLVGDQTQANEFLVIGHQSIDPVDIQNRIKEIVVRINRYGDVAKVKWLYYPEISGTQRNIFYDDILDKYIIFGRNAYVLNKELNVEKEYQFSSLRTLGYVGLADKFNDEKYISTVTFNNGFNQGVAFFNRSFNYINGTNISKRKNKIFDTPLARKNYDYKDTSVIFVGNYEAYYSRHFTIAKLNSNLDPYWIKYYSEEDSIFHYLFSITSTNDGGFILTGGIGNIEDIVPPDFVPKNLRAWVKKYDTDGNSVTTEEISKELWEITVFPNPSHGDFKITIIGDSKNVVLRMYDMQGRIVKTFNNLNSGTNYVDFQKLSPAIYIWKLENAGIEIGYGKWVKN